MIKLTWKQVSELKYNLVKSPSVVNRSVEVWHKTDSMSHDNVQNVTCMWQFIHTLYNITENIGLNIHTTAVHTYLWVIYSLHLKKRANFGDLNLRRAWIKCIQFCCKASEHFCKLCPSDDSVHVIWTQPQRFNDVNMSVSHTLPSTISYQYFLNSAATYSSSNLY